MITMPHGVSGFGSPRMRGHLLFEHFSVAGWRDMRSATLRAREAPFAYIVFPHDLFRLFREKNTEKKAQISFSALPFLSFSRNSFSMRWLYPRFTAFQNPDNFRTLQNFRLLKSQTEMHEK